MSVFPPPDIKARWKAKGKSDKPNLPGAPMSGCFVVGELALGGLVYVVEGIGTAWACWKATGAAAVVADDVPRKVAVRWGMA